MFRIILFNLLTLIFFHSHCYSYVSKPSLDTTLDNGLRLIVYKDNRAPTAVQMTVVNVGSLDEVDGKSGVAHVLEHMMSVLIAFDTATHEFRHRQVLVMSN